MSASSRIATTRPASCRAGVHLIMLAYSRVETFALFLIRVFQSGLRCTTTNLIVSSKVHLSGPPFMPGACRSKCKGSPASRVS
jgi:hypothetical protein